MKITFLLLVATCAITFGANAASMCGPVNSGGWIYYMETEPYICLRSDDISDDRSAELEHYNNEQAWGMEGICVNYSSTKSDSYNHKYLTNCTVSSISCESGYYYTGTSCLACPNGTAAAPDGEYHTNTSCNYHGSSDKSYTCAYNYYDTGTDCAPCPDGNAAASPGEDHNNNRCNYCYDDRYYYDGADDTCYLCPNGGINVGDNEIDHCYITGGNDETGTYVYTEDCYWTE